MADITLTYKGQNILELSASGNKTIKTAGKYCEDDIEVAYVKSGGGSEVTISTFLDSVSNPAMSLLFRGFGLGEGSIVSKWNGRTDIGATIIVGKIPAGATAINYKLSTGSAYSTTNNRFKIAVGVMANNPNSVVDSNNSNYLTKNIHNTANQAETSFSLDISSVAQDCYLVISCNGWNATFSEIDT